MKKIFCSSILLGSLILLSTSCGGPKKVVTEQQPGTKEVILPFVGKSYQSDKEYYRAKSDGKSPNIAEAKRIALLNAKNEIAGLIKTKVKSVAQQYSNQHDATNATDFEQKFEDLITNVVNQELVDVSIIDEKLLQTGNIYDYWVAIEVSKQSILNGISNNVSKNQKLQIDYDKKKFEEIYNQEMSKMEDEGK